MINPNDPQENSDIFTGNAAPAQAPPSRIRSEQEELMGQGAVRLAHERLVSREDGDLKQVTDSPARYENMGRRGAIGSGDTHRRAARQSGGSEHSIDRSPLHPHYQGKVIGKGTGVSSPSLEGKSSYEGSHGTPGRLRMKSGPRSDDSLDKGAAVPKFGEWDENNPSAADGFTHIFNKVREERHTGGAKVPGAASESPYNVRMPNRNDSTKGCCFPFCRK